MNATDQRTHTRKTDALAHGLADTQIAVIERFEQVEASFAAMYDKVEALKRDVGIADGLLRMDVTTQRHRLDQFLGRTFMDRVRWLVTGR